jgi:hypothetical protein
VPVTVHSYIREVADDGFVVGGVEIDVPIRDDPAGFRTHFFWGCSCIEVALLYEQPALKAVRFLQGLYGFVIADYNYESMVGYRSLARFAALLVAAAVRSEEPLASATRLAVAVQPCPTVDLQVFCS